MSKEQILTFSENPLLSSQLLGKAFLSSGKAIALILDGMKLTSSVRVDEIIKADLGHSPYPPVGEVVEVLVAAVRKYNPRVVLVGATKLGLEAAPRAAERLSCGYASRVLDFFIGTDGVKNVSASVFSGIGIAEYHFRQETVILTVPLSVFEAIDGQIAPKVTPLDVPNISSSLRVIDIVTTPVHESGLEKARIVIDIGRGVRAKEDIQLVEELAGCINASIACSRPLASDFDWFTDWLGLSGQVVSPELLLSVGVSGAAQHIVGIRKSRMIAAVNQDENAAIFAAADYGVIADLYQFIPILTERLKARHIQLS